MIELLFVSCFSTAIGSVPACQEHSLVFIDVTPMQCLMGAQPQLARWVDEHPGEHIRSWRCRSVRPGETDV